MSRTPKTPAQNKGMGLLREAWDEYQHTIKFDDLDGYKIRADLCYVVVRWKEPNGMVGMADLTRGGRGREWDMQNDEFALITEADWKNLRIVEECDWFIIPDHPDFKKFP